MFIATWKGACGAYLGMWLALVGLLAFGVLLAGGAPWYIHALFAGFALFVPVPIVVFLSRVSIMMYTIRKEIRREQISCTRILGQISSHEAAVCLAEMYSHTWTAPKAEMLMLCREALPRLPGKLDEHAQKLDATQIEYVQTYSVTARRRIYQDWSLIANKLKALMQSLRTLYMHTTALAAEAAKQKSLRSAQDKPFIERTVACIRAQRTFIVGET